MRTGPQLPRVLAALLTFTAFGLGLNWFSQGAPPIWRDRLFAGFFPSAFTTQAFVMDTRDTQDSRLLNCLERWRNGDDAAREELLDHTYERLRRLAHRMLLQFPRLRRWEQTDDVLQDAALRLHRALRDVQPESATHFFRLAATQVNRALIDSSRHHFGNQGPGAHHETDAGPLETPGPPKHDRPDRREPPQSMAEWAEFHERTQQLPEDLREIFNLYYYAGLRLNEIAALLEISESTVDRRWAETKLALRALMPGGPPSSE